MKTFWAQKQGFAFPMNLWCRETTKATNGTFFLVLDANMFKTSLLDSRAFLERISEPAQQTKPSSSYHIRNFFVKIDLAVRGEKLLKLWRRRRFLILKRQKKKKNVRPCWLRLVRNSLSILNGPAADRRVWNR